MKYAMVITFFISCLAGAYYLGRSHAELRIVKEKVEVVRDVKKKKADILNRPNAGRSELLKLMQDGKL